jgi:hypothetical protein
MLDLSVLTERVPQQVRDVGLPLVVLLDRGDVHGSLLLAHHRGYEPDR